MEEYLRATIFPSYHPVGTCKMGSDALAVVDAQLRVHGVPGLRVADASIMPTIPASNTNAAAIMIGEKAADLMLAAARVRRHEHQYEQHRQNCRRGAAALKMRA